MAVCHEESFGITPAAYTAVQRAQDDLRGVFERIDALEQVNQIKVLHAFQLERISARHFAPTTGYGYDDIGRDALDRVFAHALGCEDALVRPQIASGTHALFLAIAGLLLPGDTMLCITGKPYDTLEQAIGISGDAFGSLKQWGIDYRQVDLLDSGALDYKKIAAALEDKPKLVYMQRSRGYEWREALSIQAFGEAVSFIRQRHPQAILLVDNCYGEFTDAEEPSAVGADVLAGSLIKNPGGGLAPSGGYIAGKRTLIERIAGRLTVPGIGREVGSYAASYAPFFQGLFLSPHVTAQSLKSAALFARVFENAGMKTMPDSSALRSDIIQAVRFESAAQLIRFCRSIQRAAAIDGFLVPEPWDMPGYSNQVIMAAGAFVQGSSIELSADGPIAAPYTAYIQGALTYFHGKIGAMIALSDLEKAGVIQL
ncbi:MAG: methionine gamma-lyase family protein [Bacillota bacterium]